jgi:hypothetical protein
VSRPLAIHARNTLKLYSRVFQGLTATPMTSTFSGSQLPKQLPISGAGFLVKAVLSPPCMRKVSPSSPMPNRLYEDAVSRNQTMHSRQSSHLRHFYASFTTRAVLSAYLHLPWLQLPALSQFGGGDPNSFGKPCRLNRHRRHVCLQMVPGTARVLS